MRFTLITLSAVMATLLLCGGCSTRNVGDFAGPGSADDSLAGVDQYAGKEKPEGTPTGQDGDPNTSELNYPPKVMDIWFEREPDRLCARVADRDGDTPLTLTFSNLLNIELDTLELEVENGEIVEIPCWLTNQIHSIYGGVSATVSDGKLPSDEKRAGLRLLPYRLNWPHSQLGVFPGATRAAVGEAVEVQVLTAGFSDKYAFAYADSVAVTCEPGGDYVDGSLHVSRVADVPGGMQSVWDMMNPPPTGFLTPDDFMMHAQPVTGNPDLVYMTFNVTPVCPVEITEFGYIFSFEMTFDTPGTYHLGLLGFDEIERTYYSSTDCNSQPWLDLGNDFHDYTTSVTVVE